MLIDLAISLFINYSLANLPTNHEIYEIHSTAYCPCVICCEEYADGYTATGELAEEGVTVAADPSVFPMGTILYIEGVGVRKVQDVGGAIKGNRIDVFFYDHNDALIYGRKDIKVAVLYNPKEEKVAVKVPEVKPAEKPTKSVIDYAIFERSLSMIPEKNINYGTFLYYLPVKRKKKVADFYDDNFLV